MARNRPPSFHERGDTGAEILELKEYEGGGFQVWTWRYGSAYPIGPVYPESSPALTLFLRNLADMLRRYGATGVWLYDEADRAAYKRALWAW